MIAWYLCDILLWCNSVDKISFFVDNRVDKYGVYVDKFDYYDDN